MKKIIKWSGLAFAMLVLVSLAFYTAGKKKNAVSGDDLLKSALVEIKTNKNYPKAITQLKQVLAADSSYTEAEVALGHAYLLLGNMDSAQKHLQIALQDDEKNADALQYLMNANMQQQDTVAVLRNINSYLEHYPADDRIWLKKYVLLLEQQEYGGAESVANFLNTRGLAKEVNTINYDYWFTTATANRKAGDHQKAYRYYQKALFYKPGETEALQQLVNLSVYLGHYSEALTYNNALLEADERNTVYLMNASLIYARLHDNELSGSYAERAYIQNPADGISRSNFVDLNLSFAQKASATDKLRYTNAILQVEPQQKEALLMAINSHITMHENSEALAIANTALQYHPFDPVFIDKKLGILYAMKSYTQAAIYLDALIARHPSKEYIKLHEELALLMTVDLIKEQRWSEALNTSKKGLMFDKGNKTLLEQQLNIYGALGRNEEAISAVDQLITLEPRNADYKFKKVGLLERQGKFEEAAFMAHSLSTDFPSNTTYRSAYKDQMDNTARRQMSQMSWDEVIATYSKSLSSGTAPGYYTLMYGIGAYAALQQFDNALEATATALHFYPNDSLFLLKRSLAFNELCRFPEGLAITDELVQKYPRDKSLLNLHINELQVAGRYYRNTNNIDSAIKMFQLAHTLNWYDTSAVQNLSAIYFEQKQYDSSIHYADIGLKVNADNAFLLLKKASAYEALKNYRMAYASADRLLKLHYSKNLADYSAYLRNKANNNQVGVSYLQSIFSGSSQYANIAGIDYMRTFDRGTVTARVNLGRRPSGIGAQGGLDVFYSHNAFYYSNIFLYGAAGHAFPYMQGGYSMYRNFRKGWEGELGVRYLGISGIENYTGLASVAKYLGNTWINARGFITYDDANWFPSYQVTGRQYLNDKRDYVTAMVGFGRIPDEHSQIYNFNQYRGYGSRNIGIGFQKSFSYATMLKLHLNYTELKLSESQTLNEYDIYFRLSRNF